MAMTVNVGGVWKDVPTTKVNVGGVWKTCNQISVNVGGVWKDCLSTTPVVSPNSAGVTNDNGGVGTACYAGIAFQSGAPNREEACTFAGAYSVDRTAWLDSGSASDVWIQRVISSGTLNSNDPGSGRINLGSGSPFFEVVDTSLTGGAVTCTLTFNFYDAASGGSLIGSSGSLTLSANRSA